MSKVTRHEFFGNRFWFWLEMISVIGIPIAILHLLESTVRVEEEIEDSEEFLEHFRALRRGKG